MIFLLSSMKWLIKMYHYSLNDETEFEKDLKLHQILCEYGVVAHCFPNSNFASTMNSNFLIKQLAVTIECLTFNNKSLPSEQEILSKLLCSSLVIVNF